MKFTIDRSKWLRGKGPECSRLLATKNTLGFDGSYYPEATGKMCCLGFYCKALGVSTYDLEDQHYPSDTGSELIPEWLTDSWERYAARVNDANYMSEEEREEKIAEMFAEHGVTVEFK